MQPPPPEKRWTVELLDASAEGEVSSLPAGLRARLTHISNLIAQVGLEKVGMPHVAHVEGKLWEIRLKAKNLIARSLYVTAHKRRIVVLRSFVKKTQKTPRAEINLALERAKQVEDD